MSEEHQFISVELDGLTPSPWQSRATMIEHDWRVAADDVAHLKGPLKLLGVLVSVLGHENGGRLSKAESKLTELLGVDVAALAAEAATTKGLS